MSLLDIKDIHVLAPLGADISQLGDLSVRKPFDDKVLAFLKDLSQLFLKDQEYAQHPELVALGYWLRSSNIKSMRPLKSDNSKQVSVNKALGLVVHFTPANVDTMFVYSWVLSLLCGNNNIVRVSSSDSPVKLAILKGINQLFSEQEFQQLGQTNLFVSYPKTSLASAELSLLADARVIWGGDQTVNQIRLLPCKPRGRDISFADRYSACLINGDTLTHSEQIEQLATLLWRDTKPYAQQACSSPRVIYWLGDTKMQNQLFTCLNALAEKETQDITQTNNHLVVSQLMQSTGKVARSIINKRVSALEVSSIQPAMLEWHLGSGLFLVNHIQDVDSLALSTSEKLQTLSYWQVEKEPLLRLIENPSIKGIDRIVPAGQALDFSSSWDGYELFTQFSRKIEVL